MRVHHRQRAKGAAWSACLVMATLALLISTPIGSGSQAAHAATSSGVARSITVVDPVQYRTYKQAPAYDRYDFSSPSGNLQCTITQYEDSRPWGCIATKHTWHAPKLPAPYGGSCAAYGSHRELGAMLADYPGGGFRVICDGSAGDASSKAKVLPFNSRIVVHGVSCTSTRMHGAEAMSCTAPKRTFLTMSRSSMTFRQPAKWKG